MSNLIESNQPIVAGISITTDDKGRFNLNALHRASGGEKKKGPSYWLALQGTKDLIQTLVAQQITDTDISVSPIESIKGGINQGTYAHELLAISYAGWISPSFQLQVNKVFSEFKKGALSAVPNFNNPAEAARAWADEYEKNLAAQKKLEEADREVQRLQGVCHDIVAQFTPGMTIPAFCRQLNGVNTQQVQNKLVELGMLYRPNRKRDYLVSSYYRDSWFTERYTEPADGVQRVKVILTRKGAINLYKLYLKNKLPMKADWDGKHSHYLFDQAESTELSMP